MKPTNKEAILTAALDAAYPIPGTPHTSVKERAAADRKAFRRGYLAAPTVAATPSADNLAVTALKSIRDLAFFGGSPEGAAYYRKAENALAEIECRDAVEMPAATPSVQGESIDSEQFRELVYFCGRASSDDNVKATMSNLIAHIDARLARTAAPSDPIKERARQISNDAWSAANAIALDTRFVRAFDDLFGEKSPSRWHEARMSLFGHIDSRESALREVLHEIAHTKNVTATPQQFIDHLQRTARRALGAGMAAAPSEGLAIPMLPKKLPPDVIAYVAECTKKLGAAGKRDIESAYFFIRDALNHPAAAPATEQAKPELASRLRAFADDVIEVGFEGGNLDGGAIQEWAENYGLIKATTMTEPCADGEQCRCAEARDFPLTCYRKTYLAAQPVPQASGERDAVLVAAASAADSAYLDAKMKEQAGEFSQPVRQTREAIEAAIFALKSRAATTSKPEGAGHADQA